MTIFDQSYFGQPSWMSAITKNSIKCCQSCTAHNTAFHQNEPPPSKHLALGCQTLPVMTKKPVMVLLVKVEICIKNLTHEFGSSSLTTRAANVIYHSLIFSQISTILNPTEQVRKTKS